MYKLVFFVAFVASAIAAPAPGALLAQAVPVATSSQVVVRNHNAAFAIAAPVAPIVRAAPLVAAAPAFAAPLAAAPAIAAPFAAAPAFASPFAASFASPYVAAPAYSPYVASPYIF